MKILSNSLNGVLKIEMECHNDSRGWFCEGYRQDAFQQMNICNVFVQDNFSHSDKILGKRLSKRSLAVKNYGMEGANP